MACLEMYNSDQQHQGGGGLSCSAPMSPRISFSNDFVDTQQSIKQHEQQQQQQQQRNSRSLDQSSFSSNFEFLSVSNFNMLSADELFSKGRLLPFKQADNNKITTLRDELLNEDDNIEDEDDTLSLKPPKGPIRWKEFLGLNKRTHILSNKKFDHNKVLGELKMEKVVEGNGSVLIQEEEEGHTVKISKEHLSTNNGGSGSRNVEIGV